MTIIRAFLDRPLLMSAGFWTSSRSEPSVDMDAEDLGRELFMTWDHVRQLADAGAGLTIGSHAQSHRRLAGLDEDAQYQELASSKQILENPARAARSRRWRIPTAGRALIPL